MCINFAPYLYQKKSVNCALNMVIFRCFGADVTQYIRQNSTIKRCCSGINLFHYDYKAPPQKNVYIRCHRGAGSKIHKCSVGYTISPFLYESYSPL